ncbi:hypothetical protein [Streptomyces sp. A012304]|uniref:hypothetical protein n=1 Tax=Streptomyces sp. A012304 TaxID=375446 RepID=UPI002231190A|nr:hypothetical protein [Streptomyces sp. A012304]GKQ41722.1 hypothetical protein ALMP_82350 [Streptomyces sp. A012304]
MWPGEQAPTGGPNPPYPQHPQNFQHPQPAPPNPYQQPVAPWNAPTVTAAPAPAAGGGGGRTKVVAIVSAAAVVVAAAVTGVVLVGGGDDGAAPGPAPSSVSASASSSGNPRGGAAQQPTIAGWKVVANPDIGVAFDVPAEWAPRSTDWVSWVAEDDDPTEKPLVAMKAPAVLKEQWCASDDDRDGVDDHTVLAQAGTRGNNGAKNTEEIARADSAAWVYGDYTQPDRDKVTTGPVTPFTTASGLTGSVATSQSSGVEKKGKCDSDGKATTFAFKTPDGDLASWSFFGAKGVRDEVSEATIRKIMGTVRVFEPSDS